jgi:beta-phosphoglucomutase-like phosphatase (HAD superfamily)
VSNDTNAETEDAVEQPRALFFELENVAFSGHDIEFNALKEALKKKKISLSIPQYSRFCLARSPVFYLPGLLESCGKDGDSGGKIAADVTSKMASALIGATPSEALKEALKSALANGVKLGAVSGMEPATAKKLIEKLGLSETDVVLHAGDGGAESSNMSPEAWSHRARALKISPRACVVIGSHAGFCRSAVAAQMRCVAVTDLYTNFQDFGGADYVLEELDAAIISDLLKPEEDA